MKKSFTQILLTIKSVAFLLLGLVSIQSNGQAFDPCGPNGPGCSAGPAIAIFTPNDTFNINQPADFMIGAMDVNNHIDTTFNQAATMSFVSGPGVVNYPASANFIKGICLFNGVTVSAVGNYTFQFTSAGLSSFTGVKVFDSTYANGGNGGNGGNVCMGAGPSVALQFGNIPGNIPANAPFFAQVYAMNGGACNDTTYSGTATLTKLSGPGNLSGNTSASIVNGFADFQNLSIDQAGNYLLLVSCPGLMSDTSFMINISSNGNNGQNCPPTSTQGTRVNMGLYGGSSLDLTWSTSNKRLFAAISSPASLFYTDDTCKTWHRAFPDDSLEYGCGRGWGGRAMRVLANTHDWIGVQTSQEAGTLNALVVSYDGGTTWTTAMDGSMLTGMGMTNQNVSGMSMTDYYMYCLMGKYVIRIHDGAAIVPASDILTITNEITGINSSSIVKSIAVANNATGYPMYLVVDTTGQMHGTSGMLYRKASAGSLPVQIMASSTVSTVFTHPGQVTGDTIFAVSRTMGGSVASRSFDGGTTWTTLTSPGVDIAISDVDYSPSWVSSMPASNGLALIIPGSATSYDLGDTWTTIGLQNNGGAIHPDDLNMVVGTRGRGVAVSTTGSAGPYVTANNYGLEAVTIKKISRTATKGDFYIATKAGLAYTTAYMNDAVAGYDKWNAPYGQFPVANVGDDAGVTAVAIDPSDSLHVIAGYSNGFSVTTTGVTGFQNVLPASWNLSNGDPAVNDIMFVNSTTVLAVTGGDNNGASGKGNIWRSTNGGTTWTIVSPVGFTCGNSLAKGSINSSAVIYCGTGLSGSISDPGVLWKSIDDGATWTQVNYGPAATNNPAINNLPIYDIAVDPRGTDTLYLACGSNTDYAFVKSTNGGSTYQTINARGEGSFTSVCINQTYPDSVYMAIRRDILNYDATTDSVTYIYRGLPGELVPDLAYGSVLAGTSMGFFRVNTDTPIINGVSSFENPTTVDELMIYPNPVRDEAVLLFNTSIQSKVEISIYDLTGKVMIRQELIPAVSGEQSVKVDTHQLAAGTYYVRVNKDGGKVSKVFIRIN